MTTKPSIMDWERRDPLELINYEEKLRFWTRFCLWMVALVLGLTLIHVTVFGAETKVAKLVIQDDTSICSEALMFFVSGETEITNYCVGLAQRGL